MGIKAYGKFFSWEDTLFYPKWESEGASYLRILGHEQVPATRYRSPVTEPEKDFSNSPGIYLLHNETEEIVYVGQARKLLTRLIAHTGDHLRGRWSHFSWYALDEGEEVKDAERNVKSASSDETQKAPADEVSLDVLEAVLRTSIEPRLNLQSGRWGDAKFFAQSVEYEFTYIRENYEEILKVKKNLKKLTKQKKK